MPSKGFDRKIHELIKNECNKKTRTSLKTKFDLYHDYYQYFKELNSPFTGEGDNGDMVNILGVF